MPKGALEQERSTRRRATEAEFSSSRESEMLEALTATYGTLSRLARCRTHLAIQLGNRGVYPFVYNALRRFIVYCSVQLLSVIMKRKRISYSLARVFEL